MKVAPAVKAEMDKSMPKFEVLSQERAKYIAPDKVLQAMDSTFETFFFKRDYTERNFCFYMQVCAQQHKPDEVMKAFDRMLALNIKPTDHIFTQMMLAYAKTKNLDKVLELNELASSQYGLKVPSLPRFNSMLLAYTRVGQPENAEKLLKEIREEHSMEPDVVCVTTVIDGYYK